MELDIQFRIKNNPNYLRYIRENSYWYKILNRNPEFFRMFEEEAKEKLELRTTDKIKKAMDTIEILQNVLSSLK